MPKTLRFLLVFVMLITLCWVGYSKFIRPKPSPVAGLIPVIEKDDEEENEEEEEDGIKEAQEMEFEMTKDLTLGYVPKFRLVQAGEQLIQQRRAAAATGRLQGLSAFTWTERGPYADAVGPSNGNGRITNDQVTSGRMRAIWTDLADATNKTIWVGGIDGGIWKTTDITADPSPWTLVTDATANIAIASICQSPVNTNIMYFGTGEKTLNADAVRGGGVWKSTDHGVTWSLLPSTLTFFNVSKVVCDPADPNVVYVSTISSTDIGVRRSSDGGTTWTDITPAGLNTSVTEMEISSTGRLHIVCGYYNGYYNANAAGYRFTDAPSTVTSATWTTPAVTFTPTAYNVDITVAGNTLYALPASSAYETPQAWKSTDGGNNWATVTAFPTVTAISSGQAWYNLAIGVNPTNPNMVMAGGLNSYLSIDGGLTWVLNSTWVTGGGATANYIHADHHIIEWNGSEVMDGGDGGLFFSNTGGLTFSDRNDGLRLKQFYSVAIHPTSTNYFLAGAQDNGCHQLNGPGLTSSVEVTGGDGAFMHIDQDEPQYQFGSYVFSNYRRSTDGGATWGQVNYGNTGQFINPTDYDDIYNRLYGGWSNGAYFRWESPATGTSAFSVAVTAFNGAPVTHVAVSPYTSNRVFFGTGRTGGGRIVRVDNANQGTPTVTNLTSSAMLVNATVTCIAVGTNDNNLLATYSNYGLTTKRIWATTVGGGASGWTDITGNFPDIPVRWIMYYPEDNTKAIVGSDLGVWTTSAINGAATVWAQETGFPIVRTDMLQYRPKDGLLAAATHGRGIWTTTIPFTVPYIRYAFNYNGKTEATAATTGCRSYTDYTVTMNIDLPPTGNANVTLLPGGTALQGVDYDITTNGDFNSPSTTLTFASGATTSKTFTLRIYNDDEVENAETISLGYTIGTGTNAVAAPSSSTYTFTITDNDVAPVSATNAIATAAGTNKVSNIGNNGLYYFYSGTNVINSINNASANLGCVTSTILEAGNTWQTFQNGERSQKVFEVTPSVNNATASYTIGLYYTLDELAGKTPATLKIAKTTAATIAGADVTNTVPANTTVVAYGTGYLFTATFTGFSKFFLIDATAIILPVTLLNFDGQLTGNGVQLNWSTSTEQNSKQYVIEKSGDGNNFRPLGVVAAAGNSSSRRNYNYFDKQVDEYNYYRLKMVDIDGKFSYSNVVLIVNRDIKQALYVLNNPFTENIGVRITKMPKQKIQATLLSVSGAVLYKTDYNTATQLTINTSSLALSKGTYILRILVDGVPYTSKVIKQ